MNEHNSFTVPAKELKDAVKHLKKLINKVKPKPSYPILDVIVKLDAVELRLVGLSRIIKTPNKNIFSLRIPFNTVYVTALGCDEINYNAIVTTGSIEIGQQIIKTPQIELFHPENLQPIDLTLNPSIMDILALRFKHTEEELKAKDYFDIVLKQEEILDDDIADSIRILSKYGIKRSTVIKMISENIKRHSMK